MRANVLLAFGTCILSLALINCKGKSGDSRSGDGSDDPDADTLSLNPLAESYPQGLSMAALSDESSGDSGDTSGALAIDDSLSLLGDIEPSFELATSTDLLGYDRSACETYHDGLASDKQMSCACSLKQSRSNMPGDDEPKPGGKDAEPPSEQDILGTLFKAPKEQIDEANDRLRGKDDVDCFGDDTKQIVRTVLEASKGEGLYDVYCYEFDWGIEFPYRVNADESARNDKEVCLVAFTRKEIAEGSVYLQFATQMTQAMLCQAKKSELASELSEGESIDLTESLDALDQKTVEPTLAKISRLDDEDGAKVYQTDYSMNVSSPEGGDDLEFEFTITHSPSGEDNKEYKGILSFSHSLADRPNESSTKFKALSIAYSSEFESDSSPRRVKMELRMGEFKEGAEPFDDGQIDFNVDANSDGSFSMVENMNQNLSNMKYVLYDGYPTEGVMNFAYWRNPGEAYNENARGFIFNIERTEDNVIKGCGYAGATSATDVSSADGLSIRRALAQDDSLEPQGFLRPFLCPYDPPVADPSSYNWADASNRNRRFGPNIWKQCFTQNSDGTYSIDKSQTDNKDFSFAKASSIGDFVAPPPPPPPPKSVGPAAPARK